MNFKVHEDPVKVHDYPNKTKFIQQNKTKTNQIFVKAYIIYIRKRANKLQPLTVLVNLVNTSITSVFLIRSNI